MDAVGLPPSSAAPLEFNFFKKFKTASGGFDLLSSAVVFGFVAPPKLFELLRCNFGVLAASAAPSVGFLFKCSRVLFNGTPEDPDIPLLCKEGMDVAFPPNGGGGGILLPLLIATPGVVLCALFGVVVEKFGCGEDGMVAIFPEERSS